MFSGSTLTSGWLGTDGLVRSSVTNAHCGTPVISSTVTEMYVTTNTNTPLNMTVRIYKNNVDTGSSDEIKKFFKSRREVTSFTFFLGGVKKSFLVKGGTNPTLNLWPHFPRCRCILF